MTRPEEPQDDLPPWTMQPATDPWATINRPVPTVYLGGPDLTAVQPPGPNPGAPAAPTVHRGGPAPAPVGPTMIDPTPFGGVADAGGRRPGGEVRFGPGVPVAAPGWPGPAPARRTRPPWRRLVSLASSLLTLALVVVVGLYLWQRLSPLEVEGVKVAVPRPAGNRCDVTVDVVATVRTNGKSGVIRYQWFRSNEPPGAVLTEQVGRGQHTVALILKWTFDGVGTTKERATVNLIEPSAIQSGTEVNYRCRRG